MEKTRMIIEGITFNKLFGLIVGSFICGLQLGLSVNAIKSMLMRSIDLSNKRNAKLIDKLYAKLHKDEAK